MSLPAMLVDETVGEILQASQFAREIVSAVSKKKATKDPQTPLSQLSNQKVEPENTQLHDRRRKEKQMKVLSDSPPPQRARSRINFKVSPPKAAEFEKENNIKCLAKKVSTKNRACGSNSSKTVIFTNPLFLSTHFSRQKQFFKTEAPVISRNMGTQHKCLIKSPPEKASQFQGKVKNPSTVSISSSLARPTTTSLSKSSPKRWVPPFSSTRVATRFLASSALKSKKTEQKIDGVVNLRKCSSKGSLTSKLCRSFSPSRLATRFLSPLKRKKNAPQSDGIVNGVKQRPVSSAKIPAPKNWYIYIYIMFQFSNSLICYFLNLWWCQLSQTSEGILLFFK